MIEVILPAAVAVAESRTDFSDGHLYPAEQALLGRAAGARRRESATVRSLARAALAQLGLPPAPILRGEGGAPVWPDGVVGSMTHCRAYRAAAVARASVMCSVGVDAEPNEPLPPDVIDVVAHDDERARMCGLQAARPEVSWDTLLFSAKESVFKTWYPLTRRWLDFDQVAIAVEPAGGTFYARLTDSSDTPGAAGTAGFAGRWLARDGLLLTAIAVRRPGYG
ncbi:MAG TPA: 4'-phosphopantetheinyl transferase superfamily protein [Streptosporangiaceae bacterium]|nr:4'-phosphopantetheinyl transferase superfamily protein [Streptosporangiaceae bacterium]